MAMSGGNRQPFRHVQSLFAAYGFGTIFATGFPPIPYPSNTLGAGVFQVRFPALVFASLLSRCPGIFLVAWLPHR